MMSALPEIYAYVELVSAIEVGEPCTAESYNDLKALPQAMGDSLQPRLRPAWEDSAHGKLLGCCQQARNIPAIDCGCRASGLCARFFSGSNAAFQMTSFHRATSGGSFKLTRTVPRVSSRPIWAQMG